VKTADFETCPSVKESLDINTTARSNIKSLALSYSMVKDKLIKSLPKLAPRLVALVIDLWYDGIHTERRGFAYLTVRGRFETGVQRCSAATKPHLQS